MPTVRSRVKLGNPTTRLRVLLAICWHPLKRIESCGSRYVTSFADADIVA